MTYGGNSLTKPPFKEKNSSFKDAPTVALVDVSNNESMGAICNNINAAPTNIGIVNDGGFSGDERKRKSRDSDNTDNSQNAQSSCCGGNTELEHAVETLTSTSLIHEHHTSKKQKIERNGYDDGDNTIHETTDLADDHNKIPKPRRPKVSIDSAGIGGRSGGSSCSDSDDDSDDSDESEMDMIIAQKSTFSSTANNHTETNQLPDCENEDDESDIVCLGTYSSPNSQLVDDSSVRVVNKQCLLVQDNLDVHSEDHNIRNEDNHVRDVNEQCRLAQDNQDVHSEDNNVRNEDSAPISDLPNFPKKDICYICGSDLSRLKTGLRGRVAHMKRCSAKNGGGRNAIMNNDGDEADFVETSEASAPDLCKQQQTLSGVANPYDRRQWHGDANSELELNKPLSNSSAPSTAKDSTQKQQWKDLFKVPVRSLTNVLMSGARQAAKGKAIANSAASAAKAASKQPYRRGGQWSSNNNRRNGTCPAYKRITGTDFICDGFNYACKSLSSNYFLTHFHSDHYGGITKTWNAGIIYCSLPTANLVHSQLGVLQKYIHPIPMNTPTVIASRGKPITVTLLNANHCPGAIMFLFEVGKRNILHVGDFRWNNEIMMQMPHLQAFSNSNPRLDELFLGE